MFKDVADKVLHEVLQKTKRVADCGIELEIEGTHLPGSAPHWQVKAEGSLQEGGLEYITKPIKADVVETYVNNLHKYITSNGGTIKPSYRCSTHIHVNFMPEKVADVLGMMVVFTLFEPVLLSLCGNTRNGNLFCMSSYDTGDLVQAFEQLCNAFARHATHGFGYQRGKYSALNVDRLYDLGTLEARCFPLNMDGKQVSEWVSWLINMKDLAIAQPDKTFREFWKNVRQNPEWYVLKVFGPSYAVLPNFADLIDLGGETAYELTKVLKYCYTQEASKSTTTRRKTKQGIFGTSIPQPGYTLDELTEF